MPRRKSVVTGTKDSKSIKLDDVNEENFGEASMLIDSGFLLKCPPEFYKFYKFCCSNAPDSPLGSLNCAELTVLDIIYDEAGLRLVGPFEILQDPSRFSSTDDLSDCYRYFHDPPELVTILAEDGEHPFHIGYFR